MIIYFYFITLLSLFGCVVSIDENICPHSCYCDEKIEYVSCVGDGLQNLPEDIPATAIRLEIRNYIASELSLKDFNHLVILEELKLQQSQVESVGNFTFSFSSKLESLDLSQNYLSNLNSSIFKNLDSLHHLDLSSNSISVADDAFTDLINLEQLNLRNNHLFSLTTHIFTGLHKVQYLNLDANNISFIEVGTFQYLTNLAHLIISNNPLSTFSRLDFFGSRLQYIDISLVGLDRVPQSLTKFIRDLRLTKNNITHISAGDFDSYPYLGLLVLDDNCINEIENDALGRLEYLMRLWLNGNCLAKVPPNLSPSLTALYMEENKLTELYGYSFKGLSKLETLFLQRNEIKILHPCAFCDLVNLKSLDLQANKIENLSNDSFLNLTQLESLDLSQNNLKTIDSLSFQHLIRLSTLQVSRIPTVVEIDGGIFDFLHNLLIFEVYDSSHLVHAIINSTRILHGLQTVQELNIMHNRITKLRSDFASFFPSLKIIKLSGNQWHCDKSVKWLSNWIKQSNVQFYSSYNIRCFTPSNIQFKPLMMLNDADFETTTVKNEAVLPLSTISITFPSLPGTIHGTAEKNNYMKDIASRLLKNANIDINATAELKTTSEFFVDKNGTKNFSTISIILPTQTDKEFEELSNGTTSNSSTNILSKNLSSPYFQHHISSENTSNHDRFIPYSIARDSPKILKNVSSNVILLHRRVLSSKFTESPYNWDSAATVIVLSGVCFLLMVIACHLRLRRHQTANVRRDSISYYPQKDEVSIATEGTCPQTGLGGRLFYIKDNSVNLANPTTSDSQLKELLLPNSGTENGYIY